VNGLRDYSKRHRIFTLLKIKDPAIILLQETHCTSLTMAKQWEQEWGGKCFWSFGSARSKGVAIMLNPKFRFQIEHFEFDNDGRLLVLDLKYSETSIRVLNVYAPNKNLERTTWLKRLSKWLSGSRNLLVGGDFNFVENTLIDKIGGNRTYGNSGSNIFCKYKQDFGLFDPFRNKFPSKVETTWHSADNSIACRLDRFYLSASFSKNIDDLVTSPVPDSDHSLVQLTISLEDLQATGPGYWKCNTSILNDPDLMADMEQLCTCLRDDAHSKDTAWWDTAKERFKRLLIFHSMRRADNTKAKVRDLERRIKELEEARAHVLGGHEEHLFLLKKELLGLLDERAEGAKIRSRVKFWDAQEKPSQFFFRREKSRQEKATVKKLLINGEKVTDRKSILKETSNFYKTLYSMEPIDSDAIDRLRPYVKNLPDMYADLCEGPISLEECKAAIKDMHDNKSPGSDGLPREFYAKYFHLFQDVFVEVLNSAFAKGFLSESQRYGIITLACKDSSKADLLTSWRPISLLNVDYKILSKVLSKRLASVLPQCIQADQTCSVPGRSITDNLHLIRNIVDYCNMKHIPAAVVSFDQEKAFDRVSHQYLIEILKAYGFGETFIRWINLLYTEVHSSVIVNGWVGPRFPVTRSVRQGCPLSALLYVLCIEPLAEAIRKDPLFDGFKIPAAKEEIRLSQYADDTNTIVTSERSIETTLSWFCVYGKASGAKINENKCKGLWLGPWRNRGDSPFGFQWSNCIKMYGVYMGENSTQENGKAILDKVKKTVNLYRGRNLTLSAKAMLVNTSICSKLWYVGSCMIFPSDIIKELKKAIFSFIWNDTTELVSRKTIIETPLNGGLGVIDIESKLDSLICTHVKRLLTVSDLRWQDLAIYWIGLQLRHYNPVFASNLRPHAESPTSFYEKALTAFRRVGSLDPLMPVKDYSAKNNYSVLKKAVAKPPKIMDKHPLINFKQTWHLGTNRLVSPRARELNWKIAHGVLPVNDYLYSLQIIRHNRCPFCNLPETLTHRFVTCKEVSLLWHWVENIMSDIAGKVVKLNRNFILFQQTMDLTALDVTTLLVLSGEAKLAIWTQRNRVKYDKKKLFSLDILRFVVHSVKTRIQTDFVRLDRQTFENIWCRGIPPLLAKVEDDQLIVYMTV